MGPFLKSCYITTYIRISYSPEIRIDLPCDKCSPNKVPSFKCNGDPKVNNLTLTTSSNQHYLPHTQYGH